MISKELRITRTLAIEAAAAVAALCEPAQCFFWRSTEHRARVRQSDGDEVGSPYPTASLACSQALVIFARTRPDWCPDELQAALEVAESVPRRLTLEDVGSSSLAGDENEPAAFTVAQHLQAVAVLRQHRIGADAVTTWTTTYLDHPAKPLEPKTVGPDAHPFTLYHLLRGITAVMPCVDDRDLVANLNDVRTRIVERVADATGRLLVQHHMGTISPAEAVALAFCGSALATDTTGEYEALAVNALHAAARGQETSGCWPLGRLVGQNKDIDDRSESIEMSTYEIAWAMADGVLDLAARWSSELVGEPIEHIITRLVAAASYAERSRVHLRKAAEAPLVGWCSDHPYDRPMIESWTSAATLRSMLSLDELLRAWRSSQVLTRFSVSRPTDDAWPRWLRWESYVRTAEPDRAGMVLRYLDDNVVQFINRSPQQLPDPELNTVSAVLFGPPGTAKTTVAKGMADGLGWPLVQLNPGVFIERGLELIEATSRDVFDSLLQLQRAVVLFDECDELFRERSPTGASEQMRSITAFVTASMLPKLQQLHDEGRVVFVLCTNNFDHLDSAMKRRGRIDHIVAVGPPDEAARRAILEASLERAIDDRVLDRIAIETDRYSRTELRHLAREVMKLRNVRADADLDDAVQRLLVRFEPSLNISESAFRTFEAARDKFSHPHILRRTETS